MAVSKTEFSDEQLNALYPKGAERYYWNIARNNIIVTTLRDAGISAEKMLEIGCGKGIVLGKLRSSGFNCIGVDLAEYVASDEFSSYVQYGVDFKTLDTALTASIKVVLLFDVIEHIDNDVAFLESIKNTFPNLTHVVITVPAFLEIWSNFDTFNGHLRRYTFASLRKVIQAVGFEECAMSYFFHALYLPARAFTIFGIRRRTKVQAPSEGVSTILHKIVAKYFEFEFQVMPSFIKGTSIISVLKVNSK